MAINLACPHGCLRYGKPVATTIRGWKKHMTHAHGKYSEEQLAVMLGESTSTGEGKSQFLSEIGEEPTLTGESPRVVEMPKPSEMDPQKLTDLKTDAVAKKFSGRINKFKRSIAEKFPEIIKELIKDKPGLHVSERDSEMLAESIENCFEVLDIDFKIAPIQTVLTNPLWVILLPIIVLAMVFVPQLMAIKLAEKSAEENTSGRDAGNSPVSPNSQVEPDN